MPIQGIEWLVISTLIFLIFIIIAVKYPTIRVGVGAALIVIGLLLSMVPLVGLFLAASSLIVGSFLLGWGIASIMMKSREGTVHQLIRICPRCGRNLSTLPQDIKRCPYCGNELA